MTKFSKDQIEAIERTANSWDSNKTVKRACEELMELGTALLHLDRGKISPDDLNIVLEEMADVKIVLKHLETKFGSYQKQLDQKVIKGNSLAPEVEAISYSKSVA